MAGKSSKLNIAFCCSPQREESDSELDLQELVQAGLEILLDSANQSGVTTDNMKFLQRKTEKRRSKKGRKNEAS